MEIASKTGPILSRYPPKRGLRVPKREIWAPSLLPKEHAHSVKLEKDELRGTIERVAQFSDERSRAIRLQVAPGEVKIYSSLSDTGESEESMPVAYKGAAVAIGFNAAYMVDFLRAMPGTQAEFFFKDGQSAGEMRPAAGDGVYRYLPVCCDSYADLSVLAIVDYLSDNRRRNSPSNPRLVPWLAERAYPPSADPSSASRSLHSRFACNTLGSRCSVPATGL